MLTYDDICARVPSTAKPGDRRAASAFLEFLNTVLADSTTVATFTNAHRNYLYKLRKKWQARAEGLDVRWNTSGSAPGRPVSSNKRDRVKRRYEKDDEQHFDDVSRRLISRFREFKPDEELS